MNLTDYQAKYIACELTRRFPPDSAEKITAALVDAQVDLNPHHIDAASKICLSLFERQLISTPTDKSLVNYLTLRYHCVSRNGTYFQRLIYFLIVSYSYN